MIEYTSKTGKKISVELDAKRPGYLHVAVDGTRLEDAFGVLSMDAPRIIASPKRRDLVAAGITHVLVCGQHLVSCPAEIAAQIEAQVAELAAAPPSLEEQRADLVAELQGAQDAKDAAQERAYNSDTGRGWDKVRKLDAEIEAARQALADFDRAYPEVIAAIEAERREATERFERTN